MTEAYGLGKDLGKYYGDPATIQDQIGSLSHMPLFFDMIRNFKQSTDMTSDLVISKTQLLITYLILKHRNIV